MQYDKKSLSEDTHGPGHIVKEHDDLTWIFKAPFKLVLSCSDCDSGEPCPAIFR